MVRLLPTYRLESKHPFHAEKCESILKTVLESAFDEFEYSAEAAETMVQKLSQTILTQVRKLNFDRYYLLHSVVFFFCDNYNAIFFLFVHFISVGIFFLYSTDIN